MITGPFDISDIPRRQAHLASFAGTNLELYRALYAELCVVIDEVDAWHAGACPPAVLAYEDELRDMMDPVWYRMTVDEIQQWAAEGCGRTRT